jgi:hypothetical protein
MVQIKTAFLVLLQMHVPGPKSQRHGINVCLAANCAASAGSVPREFPPLAADKADLLQMSPAAWAKASAPWQSRNVLRQRFAEPSNGAR